MAKQRTSSMPRLMLQPTEEEELRELGDALEKEVVEWYEHYLFQRRGRVDTTRWREVRKHDDLRVFCEREHFLKTVRHQSRRKNTVQGPMETMMTESNVPLVHVVGTVTGTVNDALYGNSIIDTESLRVRDGYMKQKSDGLALLAVIDTPSPEEPFDFLSVTSGVRKHMTALSRPRDCLLLTGVRASTMTTGERIGVVFHHSIDHESVPDRGATSPTVRSRNSLVTVFRQLDGNRVQVFMLEYFDYRGRVPTSVASIQTIANILSRALCCDAAVKRKLHWLMRQRQRSRTLTYQEESRSFRSMSTRTSVLPGMKADTSHCDICDSGFRGVARLSSSSCICQLCGEHVCSKCTVPQRIVLDTTETTVELKRFAFCVACMHHAKNYSSEAIARQQVEELLTMSIRKHSKQY